MATIKGYSVAQTAKQYGGSAVQSGVYSISNLASDGGGNRAYLHPTAQGLLEGRTPTLANGSRAVVNHDVTAMKTSDANTISGPIAVRNKKVVCTTTTTTGNGAGLIVSFTSTDADPTKIAAHGSITIVDGGEGYATDDKVEIDGYPGSELTVTAA